MAVIDRIGAQGAAAKVASEGKSSPRQAAKTPGQGFGDMLLAQAQQAQAGVNFSKHALSRVEERGIELTPDLMDRLAGSVERAQEKGAVNILAFGAEQAFIINVPHNKVITTISQAEMKEKIFTNIDAAIIL